MPDTKPQAPDAAIQSDFDGSHRGTVQPPVTTSEPKVVHFATILGSFGLLAATAADALGVAGRHTGIPFLGSIELVQAAVVVLAASSMFVVTVKGGHAAVHMLTSRLAPGSAALFYRLAAVLSGAAFLLIAAGSVWVAADLWDGFEQTELLHIPLRWLRLVWIVFALLVAGAFFRAAYKGIAQ